MIENRTLRLGQISRKLNVGRNTIINFLKEKGHNVDSNPNAKIKIKGVRPGEKIDEEMISVNDAPNTLEKIGRAHV